MGKKSSSKLGDTRLDSGYKALIASMVMRYTVTLRKLATNRNEEKQFSRFLNGLNNFLKLKQSSLEKEK